ncbi:MAG: 50S ribosomal protein L6 [Patescibacteria group bacterium]
MSRLGKKPISIPVGVEIKIDQGLIIVRGPKGELRQSIHPVVIINLEDKTAKISVKNPDKKEQRVIWGTFARLVQNMIEGVTKGFEKKLQLVGIGFRAQVSGEKLILNIGFSHPVEYKIPSGIKINVEKDIITVSGIDKQLVGETAAQIRCLRKPEPYKGTGIRYLGEVVRKKAGKKAVGTTGTGG